MLDKEPIAEAIRRTGLKSKRAVVEEALKDPLVRLKREERTA